MSMSNIWVRCFGCDFEGVIQRRPITLEYVLPNGTIIEGYRVNAWCSSCNSITNAEEELDVASIQG